MAKFCGYCGAKMENDDRVCGMCGKAFREDWAPDYCDRAADKKDEEDHPRHFRGNKDNRRMLTAIIAVLALIILFVCIGGNREEKFVGQVMKAYVNYDIPALVDMTSQVYDEALNQEYNWVNLYFQEQMDPIFEDVKFELGQDYKMKFQIEQVICPSEESFDSEIYELQNYVGVLENLDLPHIRIATVQLTAKHGDKSIFGDINVGIIYEDQQWRLLFLD